jgi:hypothetical protein
VLSVGHGFGYEDDEPASDYDAWFDEDDDEDDPNAPDGEKPFKIVSYKGIPFSAQKKMALLRMLILFLGTRQFLIADVMQAIIHSKLPGLVDEIRKEVEKDGMTAIRKWSNVMNELPPSTIEDP